MLIAMTAEASYRYISQAASATQHPFVQGPGIRPIAQSTLFWIQAVFLLGGFAKTDTLAKQLRLSEPKSSPFTSSQSYTDLHQRNSWL